MAVALVWGEFSLLNEHKTPITPNREEQISQIENTRSVLVVKISKPVALEVNCFSSLPTSSLKIDRMHPFGLALFVEDICTIGEFSWDLETRCGRVLKSISECEMEIVVDHYPDFVV